MALLVTLAKYKEAIGETSAANDSKHTEAIEDASAAILNFTDRDFAAPQVTEDRTYTYRGTGFLEIDDTDQINTVMYAGTVLASDRYRARREGPASVNMYSYLELVPFSPIPGVMGFTYNLDVYFERHFVAREVSVVINARWGWTTVPDDVQRATIFTAADFEERSPKAITLGAGNLQSESIAEVARAYAAPQQRQALDPEPIPPAARSLLWPYRRTVL